MSKKLYEVRESPIHGTGIFAACDIKTGEKILEYLGEKVSKEEGDIRSEKQLDGSEHGNGFVYVFGLDDDWDIDGDVPYNDARFINHSCDPNCESEIIDGHIWIQAIRDIKKGEELSYNYGYDLDCYEDHPCLCGCPNCVGFIVSDDLWPKLKKDRKYRRLRRKMAKN